MAEIMRKLIPLNEGESHTSSGEEYVITEDHSISDVLRFALTQAGNDKSEIEYLLNTMDD